MSKALGSYGGFIACSNEMRDYIINTARTFIFSTALPPAIVGASIGAIKFLMKNPTLGTDLLAKAERFRQKLQAFDLDTCGSSSQIVPVIIGDNDKAMAIAKALKEKHIIAVAIRPPTVPAGTARIRFSIHNDLTEAELDRVADTFIKICRKILVKD
jgi:8-amino-7-oxononanoate synthase